MLRPLGSFGQRVFGGYNTQSPDGYNPLNNCNKDRKAQKIRQDLKPRCLLGPSVCLSD